MLIANRVKCQHLPITGTRTTGDWPSGFELSILTLKTEHRPRINARMDLFSGWLLLNDHFSLLYFANQHKSQIFYTIFHYFVAFFTLPWATPNSVNFSVFPYHGAREIVGLVYLLECPPCQYSNLPFGWGLQGSSNIKHLSGTRFLLARWLTSCTYALQHLHCTWTQFTTLASRPDL